MNKMTTLFGLGLGLFVSMQCMADAAPVISKAPVTKVDPDHDAKKLGRNLRPDLEAG